MNKVTFSLLLITLLLSMLASLAFADSDIETPCANFEELSVEESLRIDEILREIDNIPSTTAMVSAHLQLMQAAGGALSYCDIEVRLRKIEAQTHLIALPYWVITGAKRGYSLAYMQPRFPTWSTIPKYAIWYERNGLEEAKRMLYNSGIKPEDNLANLNNTGVIVEASGMHQNYSVVEAPQKKGLNDKYKRLYEILNKYVDDGNLDNSFNPALMHIIDYYVSKDGGIQYTINDKVSGGFLQFYVIDKDPKRLLVNFPCSCAFVPNSHLILCDSRALSSLASWVSYGTSDDRRNIWGLTITNDGIADLLLHWIIGHEIGHYALGHNYGASFISFNGGSPDEVGPIYAQESAADEYAFANMPSQVKVFGHMATNYLIQQLVSSAKENNDEKKNEESGLIIVNDSGIGHPNMLTRAFSLKNATGAIDFLLEDYEKRTVIDKIRGARFSGLCELSKD